jgi:hypothetical protein
MSNSKKRERSHRDRASFSSGVCRLIRSRSVIFQRSLIIVACNKRSEGKIQQASSDTFDPHLNKSGRFVLSSDRTSTHCIRLECSLENMLHLSQGCEDQRPNLFNFLSRSFCQPTYSYCHRIFELFDYNDNDNHYQLDISLSVGMVFGVGGARHMSRTGWHTRSSTFILPQCHKKNHRSIFNEWSQNITQTNMADRMRGIL